ncbi:MAG: DNA translocase FtsK 4TM domain-containing protein, partial [Opitutales bacterium]|nr:DNA translocase FtsK 4TM domain-containing protein [Opitutales bacterium]
MAKIKRGEKLGEIVGKRHIITGAALVFIGAVLALAMLDYAPGQNIFFKEYFEPFVNSTDTAGNNIFFGKIGATFCIASYLALGWATVMIPVYLLWTGFASFKRSARAVSKGAVAASIGGL